MTLTRYFLFIILTLFSAISNQAQQPNKGQRPDGRNIPADGIVVGRIVDIETKAPLEYANIALYSLRDSSIVAGGVTGPDGKFKIENVRYGKMYALANFIGYHKVTINNIMVTPKKKFVELGEINLQISSTNLEGVEITADKKHVEFKIDKKIINVSQDILASGNTAVEVLENTPSVQVDIEGNVSLRGTSNFTVLIDGRPSVLEGSDALQQIPASSIDHIEVITNPSAKYDPDGVGGIINVVMKKQKEPGMNGVVNASVGTRNKYKLDALLNYRTNRFNIFASIDYNYMEFSMKGRTEYETYYTDTTNYRNTDLEGNMHRNGYRLKGGFDYFHSDNTTISFSTNYGSYGFGREHNNQIEQYDLPGSGIEYSKTNSDSERDGNFTEANLAYIHNFSNPAHKLEISVNYSTKTGDDLEIQKEYITNGNWEIIDAEPTSFRTTEEEIDNDLRIKADYTRPIGEEGKLEAGFQSRLNFENEKYTYEDFEYSIGEWLNNTEFSNDMDFTRNIHAVYSMYANNWGSFGYQFGIRGEYTDREIKSNINNENYTINRLDYFPSIHLSRQFTGDQQVLASYSRRIDRPRGRELDPFINYYDSYNARKGNPALEPEYIDSYELGYQKRIGKAQLSFETYYRVNKNKITRIKTLLEDGTILHTYQNLNKDESLGGELMLNTEITNWFQINLSGNAYHYQLDGTVSDEDVSTESTNFDGRLNATFKLKNNWRIQLTEFYRGPTATAQGDREGFLISNLAVRKDFFERRFNATITARDIFQSARREMTTYGNGFYSYDKFQRESPVIMLNLSYIINNYKKQRSGMGEEGENAEMDMGI